MATFTAVGVRLDLDGPLPVAPPYSLLKTPGVVVDSGDGRWQNGVNMIAYPEDTPSLWDACSDGTFDVKSDGLVGRITTFDPFVCYLPITCSSLGVYQDLEEQAELVLDATYSMAVETALSQGVPTAGSPYFGDANMTALAAGAAIATGTALSYLENAIGATGRKGMIHATPATFASWVADKLISAEDSGPYTSPAGNPVVCGDGYIGAHPLGKTAAAAGQDWAFATGPVEVRMTDIAMTSVSQSLDRAENILEFRAERNVLAVWDGALQAGILVDWSP